MLALLHAASSQEARLLRVDNIDQARCSVRLGERPHPVPLDPATWATLLRRLDHRAAQYTANPHVILEGCVRGQELPDVLGGARPSSYGTSLSSREDYPHIKQIRMPAGASSGTTPANPVHYHNSRQSSSGAPTGVSTTGHFSC
jgi:hypothetical protein